MTRTRRGAAVVAVTICALLAVSTPAAAGSADGRWGNREPITVIVGGLDGPRQLADVPGGVLVTESDIGQVTTVDLWRGRPSETVTGLGEGVPQGAVKIGSRYYIVTAEAGGPPEDEMATLRGPIEADPAEVPASSVVVASRKSVTPFADLLAHEIANNPDGQTQFGPDGAPLDALSNPFFVLPDRSSKGHLFVADAGANAVLRVNRKGVVSTFFVPPVVNEGSCTGRPNNDEASTGCDPVPTGLAYGPRNTLYVSALTAEVAGEGRVYVVDARTGILKDTITGLSGPTGVAVDRWGNVYVSELLESAPPPGPPPPGFDPSTVGQIVKITPRDDRSYAQVTMPTGLLLKHGALYASAWSIASFLGIPDRGEVVRVSDSAFVPGP